MGLSDEALNRLAQIGYTGQSTLKFWQGLWDSEGAPMFWRLLQQEEGAAKQYRHWFPILQEFTDQCRRQVAVPSLAEFTHVEREQYRILKSKMEPFARCEDRQMIFDRKPNQAAIIWTSRPGLLAAEQMFSDAGPILLLEAEKELWFNTICPVNHESFGWYAFAWWSVREQLDRDEERDIRQYYSMPAESVIWIVTSGVQWGSLAGGASHEAWAWDGEEAAFIGEYCIDTY